MLQGLIPNGGISIHAPRTGSDMVGMSLGSAVRHFNPRSPHGERHWDDINKAYSVYISIHAPRTGSDLTFPDFRIRKNNFNPRSPHGERRGGAGRKSRHAKFQSTLPARGATEISALAPSDREISIHAPRTGSDWDDINKAYSVYISIHAPRTGSDLCVNVKG